MNRFDFWQKWLLAASVGITVFGLFMAFFNQTPLFDVLNSQVDPSFWGSAAPPEGVTSFQGWLYGVWGATIAGWGIFLIFITQFPFKQRERWAWNCLAWGLGVWYLLDTGLSWYDGVIFNVLFNTAVVLTVGLPLIFTRESFRHS